MYIFSLPEKSLRKPMVVAVGEVRFVFIFLNFPSNIFVFVFKHKNQIILNFSSINGIYEKDILSKIDQIFNFLISDPIYNKFCSKMVRIQWKCINASSNVKKYIFQILINFYSKIFEMAFLMWIICSLVFEYDSIWKYLYLYLKNKY